MELLCRNSASRIVDLKLHVRRRAVAGHGQDASLGHGIKSVLDEIEQHATEWTLV